MLWPDMYQQYMAYITAHFYATLLPNRIHLTYGHHSFYVQWLHTYNICTFQCFGDLKKMFVFFHSIPLGTSNKSCTIWASRRVHRGILVGHKYTITGAGTNARFHFIWTWSPCTEAPLCLWFMVTVAWKPIFVGNGHQWNKSSSFFVLLLLLLFLDCELCSLNVHLARTYIHTYSMHWPFLL